MKPPVAAGAMPVARAVSLLLHPFVVFTGLVLVAAWRLDPASLPRASAGILVVVAMVWLFAWRRWRSGRWSTVDASNRQERPALYGLALLLAAGYWWWLGGTASAMSTGVLAATTMICVAGLANCWIKLSLHMASLAFAGMTMLALWWPGGAALLLFAPLLAWSRLRMGRHTGAEVAGGAMLGVLAGATLLLP